MRKENLTNLQLFGKKQVGGTQIASEERLFKVARTEDLWLILSRMTTGFSKDRGSKSHLLETHW
jgi:hypothetical protein